MKKIFGFIIGCTLLLTLFAYVQVAHAGIVPDCNTGAVIAGTKDTPAHFANPCNFNSVMTLVNTTIRFLLLELATPLAAIIICYAGFLMLTSGGSSEKTTKAKKIIKNIIFGYMIALAAWLTVHTIFTTLGVDTCLNWLGNKIPACEVSK